MKACKRRLSSSLELTRMWRSIERANLEKKPSMRLSHDLRQRESESKAPDRLRGKPARRVARDSAEWLSRMTSIAVSAASRSLGTDQLAGTVTVSDEGMDVTSEQIDAAANRVTVPWRLYS
jgi:hypothetical protein